MAKRKMSPAQLANLHLWKPGQSGNPKGYKPKLAKTILKSLHDEGYRHVSRADIIESIQMLISMSKQRLEDLVKDESQPQFLRTIADNIANDKSLATLETLLDRVHGRPKQTEEVSGNVTVNITRKIIK